MNGFHRHRPDLACDDETAHVTFAGRVMIGPNPGIKNGINQVRVDLETGKPLQTPRLLWSGTGLKYPEAPHLYHRGDDW